MYGRNIIRLIKGKESIDYNRDLLYIVIKNIDYYSGSNRKEVRIDNKEDIEQIVNYINSLELIKEDAPNYYDGSIEYVDISKSGYFSIDLVRIDKNRNGYDSLVFSTEYVTVCYNSIEKNAPSYYIVDSGYNPENKTSKFSDF